MICIADINIRSYHKRHKKVLTRSSWCTRGSAGWRSSQTSQPKERWCWSKPSRGETTEDQPACTTIQIDLVPMRICAKPWTTSPLKETKDLLRAKPNTSFITWLFTLKKLQPKTFETLLFSRRTICELKHKTPSLRLGKVTLPRGKLECRSYLLRPRETKYQMWTLVQCCPEGRVAVSGAGAGRT